MHINGNAALTADSGPVLSPVLGADTGTFDIPAGQVFVVRLEVPLSQEEMVAALFLEAGVGWDQPEHLDSVTEVYSWVACALTVRGHGEILECLEYIEDNEAEGRFNARDREVLEVCRRTVARVLAESSRPPARQPSAPTWGMPARGGTTPGVAASAFLRLHMMRSTGHHDEMPW